MDDANREQLRDNLRSLLAGVEHARAEVGAEIPTSTLSTLLYIALHRDCGHKDVAKALNLSKSSTQRNISNLTRWAWSKAVGPGLVEAIPDAQDMRVHKLRLTAEGERVVASLSRAMAMTRDL